MKFWAFWYIVCLCLENAVPETRGTREPETGAMARKTMHQFSACETHKWQPSGGPPHAYKSSLINQWESNKCKVDLDFWKSIKAHETFSLFSKIFSLLPLREFSALHRHKISAPLLDLQAWISWDLITRIHFRSVRCEIKPPSYK